MEAAKGGYKAEMPQIEKLLLWTFGKVQTPGH